MKYFVISLLIVSFGLFVTYATIKTLPKEELLSSATNTAPIIEEANYKVADEAIEYTAPDPIPEQPKAIAPTQVINNPIVPAPVIIQPTTATNNPIKEDNFTERKEYEDEDD